MSQQEEVNTGRVEKTMTFFRFEDLRVYHKSLDYVNWLHDASMLYPEDDKTGLIKRFNASARNISFYIPKQEPVYLFPENGKNSHSRMHGLYQYCIYVRKPERNA